MTPSTPETETNPFDATRAQRGVALECTREHFEHCLNVLPPVYARGCFGVGEPYSHEVIDGREYATRHWCCERAGKCWCLFGLKTEAEATFARL